MKNASNLSIDNLIYLLNFVDPKTLSRIAQLNKLFHKRSYNDSLWAKFVTKQIPKKLNTQPYRDVYINHPKYRSPAYRDYDMKGRLYSFELFLRNEFEEIDQNINPGVEKKFKNNSKKIENFIQSGELTLNKLVEKKFKNNSKKIENFIQSGELTLNKLKDFVNNFEKIANIENNSLSSEYRRHIIFIDICNILAESKPLINIFSISPDWLLTQVEQSGRSNYKKLLILQIKALKKSKQLIEEKLLSAKQVIKFINDIKTPGAISVLCSLTHALELLPEQGVDILDFLGKFCEDETETDLIELTLSLLENNIAKDKKLYAVDDILQAIIKSELCEIVELTINYCWFRRICNVNPDTLLEYCREKSRADLIHFMEACINILAIAKNSQITYKHLIDYAIARSGGDLQIMADCFARVIHWINSGQLLLIDLWNYACKTGALKLLGLVEFLLRLEAKKIIYGNDVTLDSLVKIVCNGIPKVEKFITMAEKFLIRSDALSIEVYADYLMAEEFWRWDYHVERVIESLKYLDPVLKAQQLNANSLLKIKIKYKVTSKNGNDFSDFIAYLTWLIRECPSTKPFLTSIIVLAEDYGFRAGLLFVRGILRNKKILEKNFLTIDDVKKLFYDMDFDQQKSFERFCEVLAHAIILIEKQVISKDELFSYLNNYDYYAVDRFVERLIEMVTLVEQNLISKTIAIKICSYKDTDYADKLIDIFIKAEDILKNKAIEPEKLLAITHREQGIGLAEIFIKLSGFSITKITEDDLITVARDTDLPDYAVQFLQNLLNSKTFIKSQTLSIPELVEKLLEPKSAPVNKYYFWRSAPVNSPNMENELIPASMFAEKTPTNNIGNSFCCII